MGGSGAGAATRGTLAVWGVWSLLAATTHLLGAVLSVAAATVLALVAIARRPGSWPRAAVTWFALAAAGCSLQAAWLVAGQLRPGFAVGTTWIRAPGTQDVLDLVTTVFSSGGLTPHADGFAWTSPVGALAVVAGCVAAAVTGRLSAGRPPGRPAPSAPPRFRRPRARRPPRRRHPRRPGAGRLRTPEAGAATVLLSVASITTASVFAVSQWRHIWTLRNMIVVTPALLWGVICLAAALAGGLAGRRAVATVAVALFGLSLLPVADGLARPYKTDARALVAELVRLRAEAPSTTFAFVGSVPPGRWRTAADRPADRAAWADLTAHAVVLASPSSVIRVNGPQVVTVYHGVADPLPAVGPLAARLGPTCQVLGVYGFGVVHCD